MNAVLYVILCGPGDCSVTAVAMPDFPTCMEATASAAGTAGMATVFAVCGSDKYAVKKYFTTERPAS